MFVVPLPKDFISTRDKTEYRVIEYTNFKEMGPAVYARDKESTQPVVIYFTDIDRINDVKVEYDKSSRTFKSYGKIDRKIHLPQPDDSIIVMHSNKIPIEDKKEIEEVLGLKLKSKTLGINKGLVIKVNNPDSPYIRLSQILDIERSFGSSFFDRKLFLSIYSDYKGV